MQRFLSHGLKASRGAVQVAHTRQLIPVSARLKSGSSSKDSKGSGDKHTGSTSKNKISDTEGHKFGSTQKPSSTRNSPTKNLFNQDKSQIENSTSWSDNIKKVAKKVTNRMTEQISSHMSGSQQQRNGVTHEPQRCRFVMDLGNKQLARIDYRKLSRGSYRGDSFCYDLYHTEVPPELRGKGIGAALAKGALDQLAKEGAKVRLSCSYLVNYVEKQAPGVYSSIIENSKRT